MTLMTFPLHGWLVRVYPKFNLIGAWKYNQIRWDFHSHWDWDSLDPTEPTNNTKKSRKLSNLSDPFFILLYEYSRRLFWCNFISIHMKMEKSRELIYQHRNERKWNRMKSLKVFLEYSICLLTWKLGGKLNFELECIKDGNFDFQDVQVAEKSRCQRKK